jgi:CRP/FNR family cyclic AMP-dependent transcriptional regulator
MGKILVDPLPRNGGILTAFFLRAVELFQGISDEDALQIGRLFTERHYPRGATIFSLGASSDSMYVMREGVVRLSALSERGAETILHILKPDEIFGELLFSEEKRSFTAIADTDTIVTVIPRENFVESMRSVPSLAENFIRLLSRRLAKVEKEFAEFGHTWSYNRLAKVLLLLADEHGVDSPAGTRIPLRLTHEDLAKLIGTTRETVTTQINRFRKKGLVKREGHFFLVNRKGLKSFLRSE